MCGEQGIIAVHETMHLVNFLAKVANFFFSNAYVTLLSTTGKNKLLKHSSRIHMDLGVPGRTTTEPTCTISGLC